MRVFWSGAISFGLVNIPIKLFPATRPRDVHFNQLHALDGGRVRYRKVCELCGQELAPEDIVKGYEYAKERFVTFSDEELDALATEASKSVDIFDFVDLGEIDPVFFQKAYYVAPQKGAAKAYHLLREAMERTGKVAVASFILKTRAHLAMIRQVEGVLVLETMLYGDEVVPAVDVPVDRAIPTERELDLAVNLVQQLSVPFDAAHYKDLYRERLDEAIARKVEGREIVVRQAPERAEIVDLMDALEASPKRRGAQEEIEFRAASPETPRLRTRRPKRKEQP